MLITVSEACMLTLSFPLQAFQVEIPTSTNHHQRMEVVVKVSRADKTL